MTKVLNKPVLVLNRNWLPIAVVTVKDALTTVFGGLTDEPKALIIDPSTFERLDWEDWSKLKVELTDEVIRSANMAFRIPEVILLTGYDRLPSPKVNFSRRTLYKRDNNTCQYCGNHSSTNNLSIDHVVPRSKGGKTTWENCVLACVDCNAKKADRLLSDCGMKLRCTPKKPTFNLFKVDATKPIKSWTKFLGEAYWATELENDNEF